MHGLSAQVTDTVSLGASISNQSYYKLIDGSEANDINSDWDIAFQTESAYKTSIIINAAIGTELYLYPGDTTDWTTLDTTGMKAGWTQLFNADSSWDYGAFSQNQTSTHVGWGDYNMTTHAIEGDKIFVIKLSNGTYNKVWIENLLSGVYNFRHATLDNSMDMQHSLDKADFAGKNFGYFSLQTHSEQDKEPMNADWDLFFGKYTGYVPTPYPVVGVLLSSQTEASKAYPVNDPSTYIDWGSHVLSNYSNVIGSDWKSFDFGSMSYVIADSTVYFVKTQDGDVFKMVFTHYGGSSTGDIVFEKTHVHFSGVQETENNSTFDLYPNPASDVINVAYYSDNNSVLDIIDLNGKVVMNKTLRNGEMIHRLYIDKLPKGMYVVNVRTNSTVVSKKLIVQ